MTKADTIFKENITKIMEEEFGQSKHVLNTRMAQQPIPNTSQGLLQNMI